MVLQAVACSDGSHVSDALGTHASLPLKRFHPASEGTVSHGPWKASSHKRLAGAPSAHATSPRVSTTSATPDVGGKYCLHAPVRVETLFRHNLWVGYVRKSSQGTTSFPTVYPQLAVFM